jgi:hypothetical protein
MGRLDDSAFEGPTPTGGKSVREWLEAIMAKRRALAKKPTPTIAKKPIAKKQPVPKKQPPPKDTTGMKKCGRCHKWLPLTIFAPHQHTGAPIGSCPPCKEKQSEYMKEYHKTPAGKAVLRAADERRSGTAKRKASDNKRAGTEKRKASKKRARTSDKGKASLKRARTNDKGRARNRKRNSEPLRRIAAKIRQMLSDKDIVSTTVVEHTDIKSNAQLVEHLESTFDKSWMTWQNRGVHKTGATHKVAWQIGHRIPCVAYDANNPADLGRCFVLANMRAQDAKENHDTGACLPSNSELLNIRHVWPLAWNDKLPTQKWRKAFYKEHRGRDLASGEGSSSSDTLDSAASTAE